ncbi:parathymosin [Macrotis lagotis]|uniref:parathymosin n=1 Tax=Macrotis lagotis TaxID=92651 RepID=UPI003D68140B
MTFDSLSPSAPRLPRPPLSSQLPPAPPLGSPSRRAAPPYKRVPWPWAAALLVRGRRAWGRGDREPRTCGLKGGPRAAGLRSRPPRRRRAPLSGLARSGVAACRARSRRRSPRAVQGPSSPGIREPGPGTMSEKSVEAAPELSAKDLKEKKEKVEEKTSRKERKKDVVEEEENGAEEEEEETAEDGDDDDEGEEEDEEEEEDDDEGPALKRAAEDEDEADPKRQKTENGASV